MILGLDASTSFVGLTLLDDCGKIVKCECLDLRKIEGEYEKLEKLAEKLKELNLQHDTPVFIEEALMMFQNNRSMASVISKLQRWNGMVCGLLFNTYKIKTETIGVLTARKSLDIKVKRGENAKEIVLKKLVDSVPEFGVEYTPKGNPKQGTYDRADSYVIAYAGYLSCMKKKD